MCRAAPSIAVPEFTHKVVRDLHWVLTSPHLLAPNAIVPTLPDEQAARIAARSHSWLAALDAYCARVLPTVSISLSSGCYLSNRDRSPRICRSRLCCSTTPTLI